MKLQITGSPEDKFLYIENPEFFEEIEKNRIVDKTKSIKLINTSLSKTEYKNLGFLNYKLKEPDYYIIPDFLIKDYESYIKGSYGYNSYLNWCIKSKTNSLGLDFSKIFLLNLEDHNEYRYFYEHEYGDKTTRATSTILSFYTGSYSFEEFKDTILKLSGIDSSKIILESNILLDHDNGIEITPEIENIIINTTNTNIATTLISSLDISKNIRLSNKMSLYSYLNEYKVDKKTVKGRNILAKKTIYMRLNAR